MAEIRDVRIGQVKIGRGDVTLRAILGSCLGIAVIWEEKEMCGLAHCLLPGSGPVPLGIGGRFVTQAIPSLLAMMKVRPGHYDDVSIVIAGGGNMTNPDAKHPDELIGHLNLSTAQRILGEKGLRIVHEDVGGDAGRKITVCCSTGQYTIDSIPRMITE